ncbi:MAG: sugar ABC transporter permease [Deltaproteobacteria bacterium]|nr:sugar ABC transporter permease [Deltaproteobacteria bacterium]
MIAVRRRTQVAFVAPALILLSGVTVYPLLHVVWLSLRRRLLIFDIDRFVGLSNYRRLLGDDRFLSALANTAYFCGVSVALELVLGVSVALVLNRVRRARGVVMAIVLLPWAIPTVVSAKMWAWMFSADYGVLNYLLGRPVNWLGSPFWALNAAILMDVWKTTPFVVLLVMAALKEIPEDLYRAVRVDGAGRIGTFWYVTLPLVAPMLVIVAVFRTLDAVRVFDAVFVLTGGGPAGTTETLSVYAYELLFQTLQFGYGSTVALSVFLIALLLTGGYLLVLRRLPSRL